MRRSDSRSSRGGSTLIEVVVSAALLTVICTEFLMMTATNTGQISRKQGLERSNYNLNARAGQGEGDPTGETIAAEFSLEGANQIRETSKQYEITESGGGAGNHMTSYRHR